MKMRFLASPFSRPHPPGPKPRPHFLILVDRAVAGMGEGFPKKQLIAGFGALLGICLAGLVSGLAFGADTHVPLIVAPMGASAVLLFAAPASPLAQPWPIIGGNTISALVGVLVGRLVPDPMLATGVAVGLAIVAMSVTRCLHPPGGAAALTAIIAGPSVTQAGFAFAFVPVCLNAILLVLVGLLVHRLSSCRYPHFPANPPIVSPSVAKARAPRDRAVFNPSSDLK